jgi:hypothetical protein
MNIINQARMRSLNPNGKWIQNVTEAPGFKKGAFGRKAKSMGYKTTRFMREVLDNPELYDETTRKQAQFMKTLMGFQK